MHERIYVCHTYYHVYIACLKELVQFGQSVPDAEFPAPGAAPASGSVRTLPASGAVRASAPSGSARTFSAHGAAPIPAATLLLSTMSNDFRDLPERARRSGLFEEVLLFDEKEDTFFPELKPLKTDTGSLVKNMVNRMRFLRRFAALEAPFVPVDFRQYRDIYVFCDSDPVGYYLAANRIRYHALEDGLDCLKYYDTARYDNRGHFGLKALLARLGLIFIQNGYSRYCIDMEVNDLKALPFPGPRGKMAERSREALAARLSKRDKERLTALFIANLDELKKIAAQAGALRENGDGAAPPAAAPLPRTDALPPASAAPAVSPRRPVVLVLTEPLCDLATRKRLFTDLIAENGTVDGAAARIVIKPHPRDVLDYRQAFPQHLVLDAFFPMEILNFVDGLRFDRVVTVYTVPASIHCARERVYLGDDFMDRYEAPEIHRQNEQI